MRCHPHKEGEFTIIANYKDLPYRDLIKITLPPFQHSNNNNNNNDNNNNNNNNDNNSNDIISSIIIYDGSITSSSIINNTSNNMRGPSSSNTTISNNNNTSSYLHNKYAFDEPLSTYFCLPTPSLSEAMRELYMGAIEFSHTLQLDTTTNSSSNNISCNSDTQGNIRLYAESTNMCIDIQNDNINNTNNEYSYVFMVRSNKNSNNNNKSINIEDTYSLYSIHSCILSCRCAFLSNIINNSSTNTTSSTTNNNKSHLLEVIDITQYIFPTSSTTTTTTTNNNNNNVYDYNCDILPLIMQYLYEDVATVGASYINTNTTSNNSTSSSSNANNSSEVINNNKTYNDTSTGISLYSVRELCIQYFIHTFMGNNYTTSNNHTANNTNRGDNSNNWLYNYLSKLYNDKNKLKELCIDDILWRSNVLLSVYFIRFIDHVSLNILIYVLYFVSVVIF